MITHRFGYLPFRFSHLEFLCLCPLLINWDLSVFCLFVWYLLFASLLQVLFLVHCLLILLIILWHAVQSIGIFLCNSFAFKFRKSFSPRNEIYLYLYFFIICFFFIKPFDLYWIYLSAGSKLIFFQVVNQVFQYQFLSNLPFFTDLWYFL